MRRVREMLRLSQEAGLPTRDVVRRTGVARSTVREMLERFKASALDWPLPLEMATPSWRRASTVKAARRQGVDFR